jgi:cyclic peptide transporter
MNVKEIARCFLCCLVIIIVTSSLFAEENDPYAALEKQVQRMMAEGKIPGLTLVIVREDRTDYIKGFGYADLANHTPVTAKTLFELASCSKAFTALAALRLEEQGKIQLDNPVSIYLPWFKLSWQGRLVDVTIRQLLNHTSGIPEQAISLLQEDSTPTALEKIARQVAGFKIKRQPGTLFEYCTINYDVVGAVIEKMSGLSFEEYLSTDIFDPLGLSATRVGMAVDATHLATGYKIGFGKPLAFQPPVYRGNYPAGYVVSDGQDMAAWLKFQIGLQETPLSGLIARTQVPNTKVPVERTELSYYAMGWKDYVNDNDILDHAGNNPNFTAYVAFSKKEKLGVVILANSNSTYTNFIGYAVLSAIRGVPNQPVQIPKDNIDRTSSVIVIILLILLLILAVFIGSIFYDLKKNRRYYEPLNGKKFAKLVLYLLILLPFVVGVVLLPRSLADMPMKQALVWAATSFAMAVRLLFILFAAGYVVIVLSTLFPMRNKYYRQIPLFLVLSILAGVSNSAIILLVTRALFSKTQLIYQLYNYALALGLYIVGRRVLQVNLMRLSYDIIYDYRTNLITKIFYTSFQKFEKLNRGQIFATLNDDTAQIGAVAGVFVNLLTSLITTLGAFIFLAAIAAWATLVALGLVMIISCVYYFITRKTHKLMDEARETRNVFMALLNGLIDGFRELSLQYNKKMQFKGDIDDSVKEFCSKSSTAMVTFIDAFITGESMLILVLGMIGFGIPRLFPDISAPILISFIMVMLYLIGPINGILNSIPALIQLRIAWNRIKAFVNEIPANMKPEEIDSLDHNRPKTVDSIRARNLYFEYETTADREKFTIGPMDFEAKKGEVVFIIGGNGSGKTTLAKLLTGLYLPKEGTLEVDGRVINHYRLGEYFSTVFSDFHLFRKIYNVDMKAMENEILPMLVKLRLQDKVVVEGDRFSTIDISGGQRKRLALMLCFLEDAPIFLFDEVAADQDPVFRRFFYQELLPEMKLHGKIVIAVTHDDHYFGVADKIFKLDMGKVDIAEEKDRIDINSLLKTPARSLEIKLS